MIRVLHYGLSPNKGGIEKSLYKIYTHINREKFHFDFINLYGDNVCYQEEFMRMGSKFFRIKHRRKSLINYNKSLNDLFAAENFDILHCHLNTLSDIDPILVALKYNCKVIVHSRSAGISNSIVTNLLHKLNSLRLPKEKIEMIAVSEQAGKWLFGKNIRYNVINNGIDVDKFAFDETKRKQLRSKLGISDELVISNVGTFLPVKNHDFMIDIFKEVKKINHNTKLVLIGDGPLKDSIQRKVQELKLGDAVLFLGIRNDVPDLLNAMDVFLMPSLYEGFPNVIIEAQTSGLPCLISKKITQEVVIAKDCLKSSLNYSAEIWARSLLSIIKKKDRNVGRLNVINSGISVEDEIKKIEKIYESLMN